MAANMHKRLALIRVGAEEMAEHLFAQGIKDGVLEDWRKGPRIIDLHNRPVDVAKLAVLMALREDPQRTLREAGASRKPLTIITGWGRHSAGNDPLIRPAMMEYLKDELNLEPRLDKSNPGTIMVSASQVDSFRKRPVTVAFTMQPAAEAVAVERLVAIERLVD
ncbi:unnamed protein product [Polarella glacialis]|uniref:Smr domain-containing protein n=1 Tax=Polarella glacialis TaxID=89957 RepID=A0A813KXK0_POLGL|nr:unnamed protein product [Polarella glacialis]